MIEVKRQLLSEDLKRQIYKGFSRHAIAMTGHDEKLDAVAFVANEKDHFLGTVVVEKNY